MRSLAVFLVIALFASPTQAQVYNNSFLRAEAQPIALLDNNTIVPVKISLTNTTDAPYAIVFLSASLKDNRGHFFDAAARPTGIVTGRPYNCDGGVVLAPGKSIMIGFTFRVSPRVMVDASALNFVAEFQAQRNSCENFSISLPDLRLLAP
jgi:hypothetical protein